MYMFIFVPFLENLMKIYVDGVIIKEIYTYLYHAALIIH